MFKGYFIFNRGERIGILVFIFFILLGSVIYIFMDDFIEHPKTDFTEFKKQIEQFEVEQDSLAKVRKQSYQNANQEKYQAKRDSIYQANGWEQKSTKGFNSFNYQKAKTQYPTAKFSPFPFNPNTLSTEKFKQLGFKDWQVKTIENYRNKGGQFRTKEDLKKIYGITPEQYAKIESYINIPKNTTQKEVSEYPKAKSKQLQHVDLNRGTQEQLIKISGIGSTYSKAIIEYRYKLGGYKYKEQLKEVWCISDEVYQKVKSQVFVTNIKTKKLNVNVLSSEKLKNHPYINWNVANAIVNYRQKHGNFMSISEIKKLHLVTDELYNKLQPYLTVK